MTLDERRYHGILSDNRKCALAHSLENDLQCSIWPVKEWRVSHFWTGSTAVTHI